MTRIESFKLTVRMDATLTVNGENWMKPGAEGAIKWTGHEWGGEWQDPIPTQEELQVAFRMIQTGVLSPILEEVIESSLKRIESARQGGG